MNPVILFRKDLDSENEIEIARHYLPCYEQRTEIPENSLVIPRYSALPYYKELEKDVQNRKSKLINSFTQHRFIANFEYYDVVKDFTPETWFDLDFYKCNYQGPFFVKGRTNSRKHRFNTLAFAKDKRTAVEIGAELAVDDLIGPQGIIYRKFEKLKVLEYGLHGLPFSNEWRFFFLGTNLISYGYYWSIAEHPELGKIDEKGISLAKHLASIISNHVNAFVLDIAEKENGEWILIEINDLSMSGLSMNDPHNSYKNLKENITQFC